MRKLEVSSRLSADSLIRAGWANPHYRGERVSKGLIKLGCKVWYGGDYWGVRCGKEVTTGVQDVVRRWLLGCKVW